MTESDDSFSIPFGTIRYHSIVSRDVRGSFRMQLPP